MSNKTLSFVVPGEPVGKERPRARVITPGNAGKAFARFYTPSKTVAYESHVRTLTQIAANLARWRFKQDALFHVLLRIFTTHALQRPDGDNVFKAVADAMNGIAYSDDKRIVGGGWTIKRDPACPRVEIRVVEIERAA